MLSGVTTGSRKHKNGKKRAENSDDISVSYQIKDVRFVPRPD